MASTAALPRCDPRQGRADADQRVGGGEPPGARAGGGGPGIQRDPGDPGLVAPVGAEGLCGDRRCHRLPDHDRDADRHQGADYVLALKENQPTLQEAVAILFREGRAHGLVAGHHDARRTVEKNHGRLEVRQVWTVDDPAVMAYLDPHGAWPNLRSVGMVVAERQIGRQPHARPATTSAACRAMRRPSARRCAGTGGSKTACIGCWISPFARTRAGCARGMPTRIWPSCGGWRSICCARNPPRRWVRQGQAPQSRLGPRLPAQDP